LYSLNKESTYCEIIYIYILYTHIYILYIHTYIYIYYIYTYANRSAHENVTVRTYLGKSLLKYRRKQRKNQSRLEERRGAKSQERVRSFTRSQVRSFVHSLVANANQSSRAVQDQSPAETERSPRSPIGRDRKHPGEPIHVYASAFISVHR